MSVRVLYVDADDGRSERNCARLRAERHDVLAVGHARAALAAALDFNPQIVLLHDLPGVLNALELSRMLRQQGGRDVLVVTIAASPLDDPIESFAAGVDLHLPSTTTARDLLRTVHAASERLERVGDTKDTHSSVDRDDGLAAVQAVSITPQLPTVAKLGPILIVDDERAIRRLAESVLRRAGYSVVAKESAVAALEWWHDHRDEVLLVLTDVVMPGGTGLDMLMTMRHDRPDLVAIVMSGYVGDGAIHSLMNRADVFLQKPFTPDELRTAVAARISEELETER